LTSLFSRHCSSTCLVRGGNKAETWPGSENQLAPVQEVDVPVIGGHAGVTILPLFSQATHFSKTNLSAEEIKALTVRTQDGGTEVVQAKAGKGSATLSMAYAAAIFGDACMRGMSGEIPVECTYIETDVVPGLPFFSTPCELGKGGIEKVIGYGTLSDYEQEGLEALKAELKASIDKGIDFVKQNK
jgi:malate dehydrogenase